MSQLHDKALKAIRLKINFSECQKSVKAVFSSKKLAVATLLGGIAFVSNGFLPTPIDKTLVVFQALAFALSSLLIVEGGATYASVINGILLSIFRIGYFPLSLVFSVVYGALVDGFFHAFKVKRQDHVNTAKLIISLALATAITGLASMYTTTLIQLLPMVPILYFAILVIGVFNGVAAGYLTLLVWNRYLARHTV